MSLNFLAKWRVACFCATHINQDFFYLSAITEKIKFYFHFVTKVFSQIQHCLNSSPISLDFVPICMSNSKFGKQQKYKDKSFKKLGNHLISNQIIDKINWLTLTQYIHIIHFIRLVRIEYISLKVTKVVLVHQLILLSFPFDHEFPFSDQI